MAKNDNSNLLLFALLGFGAYKIFTAKSPVTELTINPIVIPSGNDGLSTPQNNISIIPRAVDVITKTILPPVQQQAPPVQQQAPPVQQQAPPVQQQAPPVYNPATDPVQLAARQAQEEEAAAPPVLTINPGAGDPLVKQQAPPDQPFLPYNQDTGSGAAENAKFLQSQYGQPVELTDLQKKQQQQAGGRSGTDLVSGLIIEELER